MQPKKIIFEIHDTLIKYPHPQDSICGGGGLKKTPPVPISGGNTIKKKRHHEVQGEKISNKNIVAVFFFKQKGITKN